MTPIQELFPKTPLALRSGLSFTLTLLFFALAFLPGSARAQGFGSIVGIVSDPSGATIAGASVTATQTDTGRKTVVGAAQDGAFVFPSLPPAGYSLAVTSPGFQSYESKGIVLQADQSLTVNVKMTIGSATTTVEVNAASVAVDTTTGTLSQVIDERNVNELPLNARNAAQLTTLVAGVVIAPSNGADQGTTKTFPVAVTITANGSRVDQTSYMLNGGNNMDELTNVNAPFPFPDALQEFSVQTSNYNAEYGQNAGAVVNIVTKSGGNRFHGSAFEYLRNGYFNARPYFATIVDPQHRNQFGGTFGGPLMIPHLSSGTTTQFFFGYQKEILHDISGANTATVPTLIEEGLAPGTPGFGKYGDFGSLCTAAGFAFNGSGLCAPNSTSAATAASLKFQIYNPVYANNAVLTPFANNQIPVASFDPATVAFEKALPASTATTTGALVQFTRPTVQNFNEYFGRVDHNFRDHDHLFGHYYYNNFASAGVYNPANLLNYTSFSNIRYQSALLSETHTFTSNLLNNLIVNYQRDEAIRGGPPNSPSVTDFGVNVYQPGAKVIQSVSPSGYFNVTASAFADFDRNNYTFADDLHWVKGKHNFAFGGHYELSKFDLVGLGQLNGSYGFSATNTNNALASFQIGYMGTFTQGKSQQFADRNHFPGVYAQDSWKVSRRLTLNYGLRWETFSPWQNKYQQTTVFSPAAYAAGQTSQVYSKLPAGLLVAGDAGVPVQGVYNQYKQFMPRVGFAVDVFGNGKTAIRGGFGIFYEDRLQGFFNLNQSSLTPYQGAVVLTNPNGPFSNPYLGYAGGDPFPFPSPLPPGFTFPKPVQVVEYDPSGNFRVPVTDNFNLTVEQQLSASFSARVAYVGSVSRHEFVNLELNPASPLLPGTSKLSTASTDSRRPYLGFSTITEANMTGAGSYNSLQATIQKRLSHGLSMLLNYTWSRALDNVPISTVSNASDLNPGESYVYPLGVANYKSLDYGPSDFDHTNVFSGSYTYAFPKLGQGNGVLRAVVNGWRTSGIVQARTGDAITVVAGSDVSKTGINQDRATLTGVPTYTAKNGVGACNPAKSCRNWFNPAAFTTNPFPAPTTGVPNPVLSAAQVLASFGNVTKDSLRGPHYIDWDAGIVRSFPIYREANFDFRADYFNVVNHTNLSNPATSLANATTFGTITGSNTPRIAQLSLKIVF